MVVEVVILVAVEVVILVVVEAKIIEPLSIAIPLLQIIRSGLYYRIIFYNITFFSITSYANILLFL